MVRCPLEDCILSSQLSQRACNLCIIFDIFMTCVGHAQKTSYFCCASGCWGICKTANSFWVWFGSFVSKNECSCCEGAVVAVVVVVLRILKL